MTKFNIGDTVGYKSWDGLEVIGIVCETPEKRKEMNAQLVSDGQKPVWAKWKDGEGGWMPESEVYLIKSGEPPKPEYNDDEWI